MGEPEESPRGASVAAWSQSGNTLSAMWPRLTDQALELGDEATTFADLLLLGITTGLVSEAIGFTRRGLWALEQADSDLPARSCSSRLSPSVTQGGSKAGRTCGPGWTLVCSRWTIGRPTCGVVWQFDSSASSAIPAGAPEIGLDSRTFAVDLVCGGWWRRFADSRGTSLGRLQARRERRRPRQGAHS